MGDNQRNASVRLTLDASGFLTALQSLQKHTKEVSSNVEGIGKSAESADRKLSPLMGTWTKGFGAAKSSLSELGSSLKSTLSQVTTLGGALSLGAGAKAGLDLVSTYKNIAFAVQAATGKAANWRDIQAQVEAVASQWGRSDEEVAQGLRQIRDETGNLEFAAAAMGSVAKAATATGDSVSALAGIAGTLNEKFGIGTEGIDDAMAAVVSMAKSGGVSVEDLSAKLGVAGASAKLLGMEGKAGLQAVVGMLNVADGPLGNFKKNLTAVTGLLDSFADGDKLKGIEKSLGREDKQGNWVAPSLRTRTGEARKDALDRILIDTGGKQSRLAKAFSGDELKLVTEFGKTFETAFEKTQGTAKQKTDAAIKAFHDSLMAASKQTLTAADLEKAASERMKDPQFQLQQAMRSFARAFEKPEVLASMEKLAQLLPKVASGMSSLLEFAVDHPVLSGAGLVGGKLGGAVAGSVAGDVAGALGGVAKGKAAEVGSAIGKAAAAHPGWAAAGKVLGVAAAAFAGYELGKAAVDSRIETKGQLQNDVITGGVEAHAAALSGDSKRMGAARDTLKERIRQMQKDQGGLGGAFDTAMGGLVTMMPGGDPNFVAPEAKQLMTAQRELRELELAMAKGAKGGDKAGESLERMAKGVDRVVSVLNKVQGGGGSGTNGLPPEPGNGSGSTPK